MFSKSRIRAYARTMDAGLRNIDEVVEEYRVSVYLELIADYGWQLERVDIRYIDFVKKRTRYRLKFKNFKKKESDANGVIFLS